jgi:hypothetical protein
MIESDFYCDKFWYTDVEKHGGNVNNYGVNYYAYKLFEKIILKLTDIPDGFILVLGTHNCVSFDLLCKHFGKDRCIGYDIANPTNHTQVKIKNVIDLTDNDTLPIAFVHNDIGNFTYTPMAKLHAQLWAAKNVVSGGYFLGRNDLNCRKIPLENLMQRQGFINTDLLALSGLLDLSGIQADALDSHMLSKKVQKVLY